MKPSPDGLGDRCGLRPGFPPSWAWRWRCTSCTGSTSHPSRRAAPGPLLIARAADHPEDVRALVAEAARPALFLVELAQRSRKNWSASLADDDGLSWATWSSWRPVPGALLALAGFEIRPSLNFGLGIQNPGRRWQASPSRPEIQMGYLVEPVAGRYRKNFRHLSPAPRAPSS